MLPYRNLSEAATALGRDLTFAETVWFKYSARKHDYILNCHNILFLFLFYSLLPLPYMLADLSSSKRLDKYKIQRDTKVSLSDIMRCYKYVMRTFVISVGPFQILSCPSIKWIRIRTGLPLPSGWEMLSQFVIYFLIEDYLHYWIHRLLHSKWGYEKIHHIHHEFTAPISHAASYAHWAEILILGFPSFLGPALVPGHVITYWLWFILRQMEAIEIHSGYEFPWRFTKFIPFYGGAEYHDYHHFVGGHSRSNFASVFTYCDYIYGTDKGYRFHKSQIHKTISHEKKME